VQIAALAGVAFGATLLASGYLVSTGRVKRWLPLYLKPDVPLPVRNGPLIGLPGGLAFLLMGAAMEPSLPTPARAALAVGGILTLLAAMNFLFAIPKGLKPEWLRAAEASGDVQPPPADFFDRVLQVGAAALSSMVVVSFLLLAMWR
jgi:hypothetical protein